MFTKRSIAGLTQKEWLQLRKTGIGGSDAGAVCGLNPYASPMAVFQDKTSGAVEDQDNEAMRQGRDLEEYVARRFTEATGLKVHRSNCMYRSVEHPWMIADVDRLITGEDAGLECKTASAYSADKWKDGEIPAHYLIQCYHYMAVTGRRAWYIAVAILGKEFKYAKVEWEDGIIQDLIKIEDAFWNGHIVPGIMPDPDGSKICDEVLEHYFHAVRKGSEIPLVGFDDQLRRREELKRLIDQMEREKAQIDQRIKLYMKDSESAANERYRITWAPVSTARLDTKLLKEEEPEIYREYLKTTSTRRFTVSAA